MIHLRIVVAADKSERTRALLAASSSVCNLVHLAGAVRHPPGDLVLCDVTSEQASLVVANLRELGVAVGGSIAMQGIDSQVSDGGLSTESGAHASEAVVWEDVEARTSEMTGLSGEFAILMVLALLIAVAGILQGTSILIIGAMIVSPDFGPVAGVCVATVERRHKLVLRSLAALLGGYIVAIVASGLIAVVLAWLGAFPAALVESSRHLPQAVSTVVGPPGFFTFFVAFVAGIVGMLSLSTAKSGGLIGTLVSVTTVPAAANVALAGAYARWATAAGSLEQLGANIGTLVIAGTLTLVVQRSLYSRHRRAQRHHDPARAAAGLPVEGR